MTSSSIVRDIPITFPDDDATIGLIADQLIKAGFFELARQIQMSLRTVQEPTAFGSIVRASYANSDRMLWQRDPHRTNYWESETGAVEVWSELTDVEVLRVGIGEQSDEWQRLDVANAQTEAYSRGFEDGVASNRPSPVDRSNIKSAIREAIAMITMREGRLIGEDHSYELADAVMKVMADEPATRRFCSLRRDCRMADGHQGACQP